MGTIGPITGITLTPASASIAAGATKQLNVTVLPSTASNKAVSWVSNNTSAATVSSTGLVTAKAKGYSTVSCTAMDGSGQRETDSATPTELTTVPVSSSSIKVSWNAVSGATMYFVYRSALSSGTYAYVIKTSGTSITNDSLTRGTLITIK
jgi:uncharacterized protein YjdB